ncbi:MAG: ABC transporter permease, partial [Rhodococcus sp. (in: high G+C Gram-positive bacteria)]
MSLDFEAPKTSEPEDVPPTVPVEARKASAPLWKLLLRDRVATVAAAILVLVFLTAIFGPMLVGDAATDQDLDRSNLPPFTLDTGWMNILGTDPLGRSML